VQQWHDEENKAHATREAEKMRRKWAGNGPKGLNASRVDWDKVERMKTARRERKAREEGHSPSSPTRSRSPTSRSKSKSPKGSPTVDSRGIKKAKSKSPKGSPKAHKSSGVEDASDEGSEEKAVTEAEEETVEMEQGLGTYEYAVMVMMLLVIVGWVLSNMSMSDRIPAAMMSVGDSNDHDFGDSDSPPTFSHDAL